MIKIKIDNDFYLNESKDYKNIPKDWSKEYFCQIERQIGIVSFEEQNKIKNTPIAVLGCGGGNMVIEPLIRMGCENITICDFDKWEPSNLGRVYAFRNDIGKYKVDTTEELIKAINPDVKIRKFYRLTEKNVSEILNGVKIACILFDDLLSNIIAAKECRKRNINFINADIFPVIHSMWFTRKSITYEEIVGFSTDISIKDIEKSLTQKKIYRFWINKTLKFPDAVSRMQRSWEGFKRGFGKARDCVFWSRFQCTNLAFELIFAGILKLKKMVLAPYATVFDYYENRVYLVKI